MNKKKIVWVGTTAYMDTDLPILCELQNIYDVCLYVTVPYYEKNFEENYYLQRLHKIGNNIHFIYPKGRYNWLIPLNIYSLAKSVAKEHASLYYLSNYAMPWGAFVYKSILDVKKCVVPCHNVSTPKGARLEKLARWYVDKWLSTFKNIQVFSKNQYRVLMSKYIGKNIHETRFLLKDYGEPQVSDTYKEDHTVKFLIFGNIVAYKRIDLLIKAGNILYDRGYRNFKIRIAGHCRDWSLYDKLIRHKEIFDLHIKRIPNEEVANLFGDSHYFVQPYQDIAQSGAMFVAFRYYVPSVVSDIKQFEEFVKDGYNGMTFRTGDATSLANTMEQLIKDHDKVYQVLHLNQKAFVEKNFSKKTIVNGYINYFNAIIHSNESSSEY